VVYEHRGARIVAMHIDSEHSCFEKELTYIYLFDESLKVFRLRSYGERAKFTIDRMIDLAPAHEHWPALNFSGASWINACIDSRTLTVGGTIYDMNSKACERMVSESEGFTFEGQLKDVPCDSRIAIRAKYKDIPYFAIKQSPGSRKVVVKGGNYLSHLAVTNRHIIVNKKFYCVNKHEQVKSWTIVGVNGVEVNQRDDVKDLLHDASIVASSEMKQGKKLIVVHKERRLVVLTFNERGRGRVLKMEEAFMHDYSIDENELLFINNEKEMLRLKFETEDDTAWSDNGEKETSKEEKKKKCSYREIHMICANEQQ